MGQSYFCDYCGCYMKSDVNVRKLHNNGISHTVAKYRYMRRFDDPAKILSEERLKKPCQRYFKGYCKFDLYCNYGHYSEQELKKLEKLVAAQKKSKSRRRKPKKWPWKTHHHAGLPPSLRPMELAKLKTSNFELNWG
ncbi:zinc finger matrin-type protein 5 isoform X1 [Drosophila guanche]|uniref:Blast:Zinc finger matrin-type protein 5 n=1 Tax=Drosophila guanche TaxID=7266 RepID=A0A3B0K8R7_DROGU|nr:zinc finger matrin-type protein 5 isoform X1 [Drosophila guanche]SPP79928.1 blast:Zinc finger matrin-type protein 5 [Drosophila guanche]